MSTPLEHSRPILIVGGTGKTGRRVAERLAAKEIPVRIGSRSASPCFNWENEATWALALEGVSAAYITYYPDLAVPGAAEAVEALVKLALSRGVRRLVLLSGRGEPEAQRCERMLMESGADWTILRCSWFSQNFSENYLVDFGRRRRCHPAGGRCRRALRRRRRHRRRSRRRADRGGPCRPAL